jgi:hypothetical protein
LQKGQSKTLSSLGGGGLAITLELLRFPILIYKKKILKGKTDLFIVFFGRLTSPE